MTVYKKIIRPLLFTADAETMHDCLIKLAPLAGVWPVSAILNGMFGYEAPELNQTLFGLKFKNPVGLAAGFDKNCEALHLLAALGFGHIEVGTVTAQAQPGNPRPRIFRYEREDALINRMGFPSHGAERVALRLAALRNKFADLILGVNIGKSRAVAVEAAVQDYLLSFRLLRPYADYVVLNVSSPNTPDLRLLQERARLTELFKAIQSENSTALRILVKIAPDLSFAEIDDVLECCLDCGIAGIIATNTTLSRAGISAAPDQAGGLSGRPLFNRAREIVEYIARHCGDRLPVIAAGGIFCAADAQQMLHAGARLIQIYTALVFEGPALVKKIKYGLAKHIASHGIKSLHELSAS